MADDAKGRYWFAVRDGWKDRPRGPEGRPLCRVCGEEIPPGRRRTFCSEDCVEVHLLRTDDKHMRKRVWERDKGVCSRCHFDTKTVQGDRRFADGRGAVWQVDHVVPKREGGARLGMPNMRTVCIRCHRQESIRHKRSRERRRT